MRVNEDREDQTDTQTTAACHTPIRFDCHHLSNVYFSTSYSNAYKIFAFPLTITVIFL